MVALEYRHPCSNFAVQSGQIFKMALSLGESGIPRLPKPFPCRLTLTAQRKRPMPASQGF